MEQWVQKFWSELDQLGENEVRLRLVNKTFFDVGKEEIAREWLQQRDLARTAELDRRRRADEEAQAAQAIAAANRAAARTADKLNTRTSIAIMIAVTAVIISVLSLLAHFLK
jgi:hypothetical protein